LNFSRLESIGSIRLARIIFESTIAGWGDSAENHPVLSRDFIRLSFPKELITPEEIDYPNCLGTWLPAGHDESFLLHDQTGRWRGRKLELKNVSREPEDRKLRSILRNWKRDGEGEEGGGLIVAWRADFGDAPSLVPL